MTCASCWPITLPNTPYLRAGSSAFEQVCMCFGASGPCYREVIVPTELPANAWMMV